MAQEAGAELVCGTSLKAALDRDWDQQREKDEALTLVLPTSSATRWWQPVAPGREAKAEQNFSLLFFARRSWCSEPAERAVQK